MKTQLYVCVPCVGQKFYDVADDGDTDRACERCVRPMIACTTEEAQALFHDAAMKVLADAEAEVTGGPAIGDNGPSFLERMAARLRGESHPDATGA